MFKKIICLTTALVMAISLTACGKLSQAQAFDLFDKSAKVVNEATGLDLSMTSTVSATMGEQSQEMKMDAFYLTQNKDGNQLIDSTVTASLGEQSQETRFVSDGAAAHVLTGENSATPIDLEMLSAQMAFAKMNTKFTADQISEFTSEKKNGNTTYKFVLDGEKATEFIQETVVAFQLLNSALEGVTFAPSKVNYSFTVDKKNNPIEFSIDLATDMTYQEETMTAGVVATYSIRQIGDGVTVELPDVSKMTDPYATDPEAGAGDQTTPE